MTHIEWHEVGGRFVLEYIEDPPEIEEEEDKEQIEEIEDDCEDEF